MPSEAQPTISKQSAIVDYGGVVNAVVAKGFFREDVVRFGFLSWLNKVGAVGTDLYRKTVENWSDNKPTFSVFGKSLRGGNLSVRFGVSPTTHNTSIPEGGSVSPARLFTMIDYGTASRTIDAKSPKYPMRFQEGYTPQTQAGVIGSQASNRFGKTVRARSVEHQIAPRGFTVTIQEIIAKVMRDEAQEVLIRSLHKAGVRK